MKKIILSLLSIALIAPTASAKSFDGFYAGLYTGYAQTQSDIIEYDSAGSLDGYTGDLLPHGALYGAALGYDWRIDNKLMVGVALNYEGRDSNNTVEFQRFNGVDAPAFSFGSEITSTYSLTTHLGYIINKYALIYLTAGITQADVELSVIKNGPLVVTDTHDDLYTGYTVGFGGNYNLGSNLELFAEYRYSDYSSELINMTLTGGGEYYFDQDVTDHSARVGVIYRFF